jgi:hypothetical protein
LNGNEVFAERSGVAAGYDASMKLGVVLLPDDSATSACVELSRGVGSAETSPLALDHAGHRPHISVLHVEGITPGDLTAAMRDAMAATYTLRFLGLVIRPHDDHVVPSLIVSHSHRLHEDHWRLLRHPAIVATPVTSEAGDVFMPHVTLAIWTRVARVPLPWDAALLQREFRARTVISRMGEWNTAAEILAEF